MTTRSGRRFRVRRAPLKPGQERVVDVDGAAGLLRNECIARDLQVAREHDEFAHARDDAPAQPRFLIGAVAIYYGQMIKRYPAQIDVRERPGRMVADDTR